MRDNCRFVNCKLEARSTGGSTTFQSIAVGVPVAAAEAFDPRRGRGGRGLRSIVAGGRSGLDATARILLVQHDLVACSLPGTLFQTRIDHHIQHILLLVILCYTW